jgi:hypothetical protein
MLAREPRKVPSGLIIWKSTLTLLTSPKLAALGWVKIICHFEAVLVKCRKRKVLQSI